MSGINWGDVPTWVAGTFAAAAAFYTRGMLQSQRQQIDEQRRFIAEQSANLSLERQALQAQADERKFAHARQIEAERWQNVLRVRNLSDSPITDVDVKFGDRPAVKAHQVVPAGIGNHELYSGDFEIPVELIGPGRLYAFVDSVDRRTEDAAVLFFTDEDGTQWQLDEKGKLETAPRTGDTS
jgi:hypothetical protein